MNRVYLNRIIPLFFGLMLPAIGAGAPRGSRDRACLEGYVDQYVDACWRTIRSSFRSPGT